MNYTALVQQHLVNPHNVGEITDGYPFISKVALGSESVGERVVLCLACDAKGIIQAIRYRVRGSPYLIAALSVISQQLLEQSLHQVCLLNHHALIEQLAIPITRQHSALLVVDALQGALTQLMKEVQYA